MGSESLDESKMHMRHLRERLYALTNYVLDDNALEEIMLAKMHLNIEIVKTEIYWE